MRSVATRHLYLRVLGKPLRQGLYRMFSEKIHYLVTLEVHQDGAGGVVSTQAEVVYTQHAHILLIGTESLSDTVQEGIRAYEQAQLACEPRPCLTAQSKSDPLQRLPLAVGGASVDAGHILQTLCENPALAGGNVAEELAHANSKAHRCAAPGQVGQSAGVESVYPARKLFAQRALGSGIGRGSVDGHQASGEREPVNVQSFGNGEVGIIGSGVGHEIPPGKVWRDCMEEPSPSPSDRKSLPDHDRSCSCRRGGRGRGGGGSPGEVLGDARRTVREPGAARPSL